MGWKRTNFSERLIGSSSDMFDIEAKLDAATYDAFKKARDQTRGKPERQREFQTLLADRFHLVVHRESRPLPGFSLVIATNGPKLQQVKPEDIDARRTQSDAGVR